MIADIYEHLQQYKVTIGGEELFACWYAYCYLVVVLCDLC